MENLSKDHPELSGCITTLIVRNTGGCKLWCSNRHLDRSRCQKTYCTRHLEDPYQHISAESFHYYNLMEIENHASDEESPAIKHGQPDDWKANPVHCAHV